MTVTVDDVLEQRAYPHELSDDARALWSDGFRAGADLVRRQIAQLVDDLNYWYWRAVDPEGHAARIRAILADYEAIAARNATAARWAALDAAERNNDDDL